MKRYTIPNQKVGVAAVMAEDKLTADHPDGHVLSARELIGVCRVACAHADMEGSTQAHVVLSLLAYAGVVEPQLTEGKVKPTSYVFHPRLEEEDGFEDPEANEGFSKGQHRTLAKLADQLRGTTLPAVVLQALEPVIRKAVDEALAEALS